MARVDAFLRAGCESGRRVSLGGRNRNSSVWVDLNTDNAQGESMLQVDASVRGNKEYLGKPRKTCHQCRRRWQEHEDNLKACPECRHVRQGLDERVSRFSIRLPELHEQCCVSIRGPNLSAITGLRGLLPAPDDPFYLELKAGLDAWSIYADYLSEAGSDKAGRIQDAVAKAKVWLEEMAA